MQVLFLSMDVHEREGQSKAKWQKASIKKKENVRSGGRFLEGKSCMNSFAAFFSLSRRLFPPLHTTHTHTFVLQARPFFGLFLFCFFPIYRRGEQWYLSSPDVVKHLVCAWMLLAFFLLEARKAPPPATENVLSVRWVCCCGLLLHKQTYIRR